ncbi:MAG: DUF6340 family protein [Massilibacteroides sp.]|nr:DUF6340 family protein [Massilibacteroides sp.]
MKNALLIGVVSLLFSACSSIRYVNIETTKPAEITFPALVNKVLIVNNAVPQPDNAGYEYKLMGAIQDTARAQADSALYDACKALGLAILETDYFNDVLLFEEATRDDDQSLYDKKLTQETVQSLCDETGTGAIISLDRLLFDTNKNVIAMGSGFFFGAINVKISGVLRTYLPGRENPLATVLLSDSIFWTEQGETMEELEAYLPSPSDALREAAKYIGKQAAPYFAPHWQNELRWYYTGASATWKQASAYAAVQRWKEAGALWESLFKQSANKNSQAKIASNIAFVQEMQGNYEKALEWAEKGHSLFQKTDEEGRDYKLLSQYMLVLQERIRENQKLNIQFGNI